jgi:tetratricopeptide (TPR) repeat protein
MSVLADVLRKQGDLYGAEELHRTVLETRQRVPSKQKHIILSMRKLALVLIEEEKFTEAEDLLRESLNIAEQIFGEQSMDRLPHYRDYGRCLLEIKRYYEAEEQLTRAFDGYKAALGMEHMFTQECLRLLLELYEAWGKPEKAAEYRAMLVDDEKQPAGEW